MGTCVWYYYIDTAIIWWPILIMQPWADNILYSLYLHTTLQTITTWQTLPDMQWSSVGVDDVNLFYGLYPATSFSADILTDDFSSYIDN